jgi:hypothetical protein
MDNSFENPPLPDYSEDGVDLSLIRWMLSLTPAERLQFLDEHMEEIQRIRERNASTLNAPPPDRSHPSPPPATLPAGR